MSQTVSVVIPVYNGAHYLRAGLEHLRASTDPPLECIVVDDGSTDNSAQIARECGATVISSPHCGPSTARNLGASAASGDILLFIDADVCVHPDTISRVLWNFETDPALDALIGSYDDSPGSEDFISQYRNLMHCFVHQYGRREACAFWSGCGAIRRHVFLTYSGFDQSYLAMEDIELGYRLVHAGRKVILDKHLLVKHLKRWTFLHVLKTDMLLRGIPWTELILRDRRMPNDLNVQISDRISVALVFILFGFAAEGTLRYGGYFLTPLVAILIFMLATYWVGSPARPPSKGVTSFMAAVVAGFIWLAYAHRMLPLVPPLLLGYALLFLRGRYVHDNETRHYLTGLAYVAYLLVAILFTLTFLPHRPFVFGIYAVLVSMIAINRNFYLFFGSKRGRITALAVIPLHFLYHFYNGISFIVGSIRYLWKALTRRQRFSWLSLLVLVALSVGLSSCGHPARVRSNDVHAATDPNNPATKLPRYLRALQTRASFLMFTAHPDDEDGATLVYETQGEGARGALFTITRGEGGQNVMSADLGDSLGLIRTQELLRSDQYYGVDQYFSRLIDYGFSKSSEEANEKWGHDRLLSDAVRVIRTVRPLVIISEFLGTPIDGHGHHQVSGRIAREAFVAAGDPAKFPEQIHEGLRPWSPLKLYARVPRVPLTAQGIFGYLRMNFVHSENLPATTLQIHESEHAPESSSTYSEIARAALSYQKTQGGAGRLPKLNFNSSYHLFASHVPAGASETSFFDGINVTLPGIASAGTQDAKFLNEGLRQLSQLAAGALNQHEIRRASAVSADLASGLSITRSLIEQTKVSSLPDPGKSEAIFELQIKERQFEKALAASLDTALQAAAKDGQDGHFQMITPSQAFQIDGKIFNHGSEDLTIGSLDLIPSDGKKWRIRSVGSPPQNIDAHQQAQLQFSITAPPDAAITRPYFNRPNDQQLYYELANQRYRNLPFAPYPLRARARLIYHGVPFELEQNLPVTVGPAISITVSPSAGALPISAKSFGFSCSIHSNVAGPAQGKLRLQLPPGWRSNPRESRFRIARSGGDQTVGFSISPRMIQPTVYTIRAGAYYQGHTYTEGYRLAGYAGLPSYPYYRVADYRAVGVDAIIAPGLKIAFLPGTGDSVPQALNSLGQDVHLLSPSDLLRGNLSAFDAIVLGTRAYAVRDDLRTTNFRLLDYVRNGGVLVVQYNLEHFVRSYGPYPLTLGSSPEKVVDENSQVRLLDPANPVFTWPNKITVADFEHWVEERGHGFPRIWDAHYHPLLETRDPGQDPQKGGLLVARYGKGFYVYDALALYRQLPAGVPGAFRILANLVSLGRNPKWN